MSNTVTIKPWLEVFVAALCENTPETIERVRADHKATLLRDYGGLGWLGIQYKEPQYSLEHEGVYIATHGFCGVEVES